MQFRSSSESFLNIPLFKWLNHFLTSVPYLSADIIILKLGVWNIFILEHKAFWKWNYWYLLTHYIGIIQMRYAFLLSIAKLNLVFVFHYWTGLLEIMLLLKTSIQIPCLSMYTMMYFKNWFSFFFFFFLFIITCIVGAGAFHIELNIILRSCCGYEPRWRYCLSHVPQIRRL